jgi:hypothetical protein
VRQRLPATVTPLLLEVDAQSAKSAASVQAFLRAIAQSVVLALSVRHAMSAQVFQRVSVQHVLLVKSVQ